MSNLKKIIAVLLAVFIFAAIIGCNESFSQDSDKTETLDTKNKSDNKSNSNDKNDDDDKKPNNDTSDKTNDSTDNEDEKTPVVDNWNANDPMTPIDDVYIDAPRVLLVTDFHYIPEYQRGAYNVSKEARMQSMVDRINDEHKKDPLDAVICLGDYSLDFWAHKGADGTRGSWIDHGESYTQKFMDQYRSKLPTVPIYFAPGNHEQFSNEQWKQITGNERNTYFTVGDYLFILWDSFGGNLDPAKHSDGTYTPINVEWAQSVMDKYPDKKVIFISHWLNVSSSDDERELFKDPRVVCYFVGHDHESTSSTINGKKRISCGNYSYYSSSNYEAVIGGMWGFRDLYLGDEEVLTRYIIPNNTVYPEGKELTVEYHYQNIIRIDVK